MKIKSVSGITCYVKNLNKTVAFYETLGFETKKKDADHAALYSNWFWIDFLAIAKNERTEFTKGQGKKRRGHGATSLSNDIGRARVFCLSMSPYSPGLRLWITLTARFISVQRGMWPSSVALECYAGGSSREFSRARRGFQHKCLRGRI